MSANNYLTAAYQVLQEIQTPSNPAEITDIAIRKGWLQTKGRTPDASMSAALYTDIKYKKSKFTKLSPKLFGLTEWDYIGAFTALKMLRRVAKDFEFGHY